MILTCQNCHTRYLVHTHALGPDWRRVRCTNCSHEWYQEPDDLGELNLPDDVEPIPEAVRPIPEGSGLPALPEDVAAAAQAGAGGSLAGYAAAALLFFMIAGALYTLRDTVVHQWPPSYKLYELAGIAPPIAGEGLTFDRMTAVATMNAEGVTVLDVAGKIVNLRGSESHIPPLQMTLLKEDGSTFDAWQSEPPQQTVGPNGEIDFKASYPSLPNDVKDVSVALTLTP